MNQPELPPNLIDVLSEDSHAREHVPGARNFCVYETAFLEKITAAYPDRSVPLTVCGWSDRTQEAREAAARLRAAGYQHVDIFPGGLEHWKSRGGTTEGAGESPLRIEGRYRVDPDRSFLRWTGRNLFNHHGGSVAIDRGWISVAGDRLTGGEIRFAMESLRCDDLADPFLHGQLIAHLRSEDFFALDRFPEVALRVVSSEPDPTATPGTPNLRVAAELTLRGQTHPLDFSVTAAAQDDGALVAQGHLHFDRTVWGAVYGSGKFFARLGRHVVNDLVDLQVKVVAVPEQ